MRNKESATLLEQMEAEIRNYSRTHVKAYWGDAPEPPLHTITDRAQLAHQMMEVVQRTDEKAIFGFTEARVHTDTQRGIGREVLIRSALGGRVQGRAEPFPISIAASWEGVDTKDLARLVSYADATTLTINLYNFREQPIDAVLRVWRLAEGTYQLQLGHDANDAGRIDSAAAKQWEIPLGRFATLPLTVPPRQNTVLHAEQVEPAPEAKPLPDLAVSRKDVELRGSRAIGVTVHNMGAAAANQVRVAMLNKEGAVLDSKTIARLESPSVDLIARRKSVEFEHPGGSRGITIVLDPENAIEEILETNNRVLFTLR